MKINSIDVQCKEKQSLRMFVLSDLHLYDQKSLKKLNKIKIHLSNNHYDIICLVGDIIDSTNTLDNDKVYEELMNFIKFLGTQAHTYIVYGNHDVSSYNYELRERKNDFLKFKNYFWQEMTKFKNVKLLDNEIIKIKDGYMISGLNPKINYDCKNKEDELYWNEDMLKFAKHIKDKNTNIFLCHYPDAIIKLLEEGIIKNLDVAISGHNHNGMTQLKFFPIEKILNIFHQNNRGIITPKKSFKWSKTKILRGKVKLTDKTTLIINPAVTSLSNCAGILHNFDNWFYSGATEINFIPEKGLDN